MIDLEIASTDFSPKVELNNGQLLITGEIRPEFPHEFFVPIHEKLAKLSAQNLVVKCALEFISSSSILQLKKMFKVISDNKGIENTSVEWKYQKEDEDMLEVGEYIEEVSSFKFNYIII